MRKPAALVALPLALFCGRASLASQSSSVVVSISPTAASVPAASVPAAPSISWDVARQDRRIVALAQDGRGRIFVASEESGVWMCGTSQHSEKAWRHFNAQNSSLLDDNIYALTVDKQDRVWAGTAGHGVSVFNGRSWKNYGVLKAPIGERVFDIAVCPTDGDVWIASNVGLTRYSQKNDNWTTLYPTATLPFNHLQTLTFGADGTLFAGSQSNGLLIASPGKGTSGQIEYSKWRRVGMKGTASDIASNWAPIGYAGNGLPSNMVNDVLVAKNGTVYVATTSGLAWSRDNGQTFRYTRGAEYSDKINGRYGLKTPLPNPQAQPPTWSEDYVSCLAEDQAGMLWIGHWRRGYEVLDPKSLDVPNVAQEQLVVFNGSDNDKTSDSNSRGDGAYIKCILPLKDGAPLIGRYGFGLTAAPKSFDNAIAQDTIDKTVTKTTTSSTRNAILPVTSTDAPPFPTPQSAPTLKELNALLKQLSAVPVVADNDTPAVVSLDDDWTTRGDWLGRYGRYWANLCAIISPGDYIWGAGYRKINYASRIGPNADQSDAIRYWIHWLYTDNPNTLEMPPVFFDHRLKIKLTTPDRNRRQAEIDDHGEAYAYQKDGPHLFVSLRVPKGDFVLSLYDWNKDGDGGDNRFRDYRVSIRPHNPQKPLDDISDFLTQPELANARIRDFRRGVWKRFVVRGSQELTIQVDKNYGLNTILAGVMLDEMKETPAPYFRTVEEDRVLDAKTDDLIAARANEPAALRTKRFAAASNEAQAANRLLAELDWLRLTNPMWHAHSSRRFYQPLTLWFEQSQNVARDNGADTKAFDAPLGRCYFQMRFFDKWEKCQRSDGLIPARDVEKSIRWDGVDTTSDRQGTDQGYETVTDYLITANQLRKTKSKNRN